MYSKLLGLTIYSLPVEIPKMNVHLYWHINVDLDPEKKW